MKLYKKKQSRDIFSDMLPNAFSAIKRSIIDPLFGDNLMRKYGSKIEGRPGHSYPRLDEISVYALRPERISGKEIPLPMPSAQWPALDRTRSPMADHGFRGRGAGTEGSGR